MDVGRTQSLAKVLGQEYEARTQGTVHTRLREYGRLQRELKAGFSGVLLRDKELGGWMSPETSAFLAQGYTKEAKATKGH